MTMRWYGPIFSAMAPLRFLSLGRCPCRRLSNATPPRHCRSVILWLFGATCFHQSQGRLQSGQASLAMPSGDYAAVGGGALKIKGAKVQKKKKKRDKSSVEKTLNEDERSVAKKDDNKEDTDGRTEEDSHQDRKTESEKRYEEVRRKRVRVVLKFCYVLCR